MELWSKFVFLLLRFTMISDSLIPESATNTPVPFGLVPPMVGLYCGVVGGGGDRSMDDRIMMRRILVCGYCLQGTFAFYAVLRERVALCSFSVTKWWVLENKTPQNRLGKTFDMSLSLGLILGL